MKYDEVQAETAKLRKYLSSNVVSRVNTDYRQMQSQLRQVDGAATASMQQTMNVNCQKAAEAAAVLDKLLQFMSNSARQIELSESQIARTFKMIRR